MQQLGWDLHRIYQPDILANQYSGLTLIKGNCRGAVPLNRMRLWNSRLDRVFVFIMKSHGSRDAGRFCVDLLDTLDDDRAARHVTFDLSGFGDLRGVKLPHLQSPHHLTEAVCFLSRPGGGTGWATVAVWGRRALKGLLISAVRSWKATVSDFVLLQCTLCSKLSTWLEVTSVI